MEQFHAEVDDEAEGEKPRIKPVSGPNNRQIKDADAIYRRRRAASPQDMQLSAFSAPDKDDFM